MKYSAKYFKDGFPEWKKTKDSPTTRYFYRKISFYLSAFAANRGISANQVSYFSFFVALLSCICFYFNKPIGIVGGVLVNIWYLLDCTDGNLARSVRTLPFGDFADSISSYVLVGFICTSMGYYVYKFGGFIARPEQIIYVLLGALASSGDSLMRLIYQKYRNSEREWADKGIIKISYDERNDLSKVNSVRIRIESDFGVGGILPILILAGVIFDFLDLVVIYSFLYYFGAFIVSTASTIRKAKRSEKNAVN